MIGDLLLSCAAILGVATIVFAFRSARDSRQHYYQDYVNRKKNGS
jgi:hypothetical protein